MTEIHYDNVMANNFIPASVQFGHKTNDWNPKMAPYISSEKRGRHLFDLTKTSKLLSIAGDILQQKAERGGNFLFVGTNKISSRLIAKYAISSHSFYINYRWLGGMLTNWATIQKRIERLKLLEDLELAGIFDSFTKKEYSARKKEMEKLQRLFNGIKKMKHLPDAVIFTNELKDSLAIQECLRLGIPTVSIVDTNCNPELIPYPIPANDDSSAAVQFILSVLSKRILTGYNKGLKRT